jgi:hypothetical protein
LAALINEHSSIKVCGWPSVPFQSDINVAPTGLLDVTDARLREM